MQDRTPRYPGRVKLVPVSGQTNVYDMIRADSPTQEGDPINKSTLLKDSTAALYGLGADATPNDVFAEIRNYVESTLNVPAGTEDPAAYLDDLLDAYIAKKKDRSLGFVCLTFATVHPILGGNKYIAKVNVILQDYVSIEAISYANGSSHNVAKKFTRSKYNGVWGEWRNEAQFSSITYVGTGTYGSNNKNSVTFPDRPKMVFVSGPDSAIFPGTAASGFVNSGGRDMIPFSWSGNTLSWYNAQDPSYQLNENGVTYTCLALYL